MKWTLRSKLLVPTLAIVTAGLALLSTVSYWQSREAIAASTTHEMEQICSTTVAHLNDWFADQQANLEGWAGLKIIQTSLQDSFVGQAARGSASGELAAIIRRYERLEQIQLLNSSGVVIASSDASQVNQLKLTDTGYFQSAMQGHATHSEPTASKISGAPIIVIAVPIKEGDKVTGVLAGVINIEKYAQQFILPVKVQNTGYLCLFDKHGVILGSSGILVAEEGGSW